MTHERSVRVLLGVIALLLGVNLLVQIVHETRPNTATAAGIPDSGAQFQAMVDSLHDISGKVDKLDDFLESGKMTVTIKDNKDAK